MNYSYQITEKNESRRMLPPAWIGLLQMGRKYKITGLAIILLFCSFSGIHAQQETNYAVHANIIYQFTKYIDWPQEKKRGVFVIGVIGDIPMYNELQKNVTNKKVGTQKIVIKMFSSSEVSYDSHILFIGDDEKSNMKRFVSKTKGTSTLLVSESVGLAKKGSCINFIIVSDHLVLEINKKNIEQRNLSIASELLQLGKVVK